MQKGFDSRTVTRKNIHPAMETVLFNTDIGLVLVRPAAGICAGECGACLALLYRALDNSPTGHYGLNAPDPFNRDFMIVDGGTDASNPIDVRLRVETLMSRALPGENQSASFVQTEGWHGYTQHPCYGSYREERFRCGINSHKPVFINTIIVPGI